MYNASLTSTAFFILRNQNVDQDSILKPTTKLRTQSLEGRKKIRTKLRACPVTVTGFSHSSTLRHRNHEWIKSYTNFEYISEKKNRIERTKQKLYDKIYF